MELQELIAGCIKKNDSAREKLYLRFKNDLFYVCLKYCSSFEEAEDHLHDTFIEVFEKIKTYKNKGSFIGWMKRIAINKAIDKYKKKRIFEIKEESEAVLTEDIPLDHDHIIPIEELMKFIHGLPPRYRIIFNLYELDGFSHNEIASMLKISQGTSKSNLFRAKLQLKERISKYLKEETIKQERRGIQ